MQTDRAKHYGAALVVDGDNPPRRVHHPQRHGVQQVGHSHALGIRNNVAILAGLEKMNSYFPASVWSPADLRPYAKLTLQSRGTTLDLFMRLIHYQAEALDGIVVLGQCVYVFFTPLLPRVRVTEAPQIKLDLEQSARELLRFRTGAIQRPGADMLELVTEHTYPANRECVGLRFVRLSNRVG